MKRLVLAVWLINALIFAASLAPVIADSSSTAWNIRTGANLPASCRAAAPAADVFIKTGSSPGLYICTSTNTWSGPVPTTAGASINSSDNYVPYRSSASGFGNSILRRVDANTMQLEDATPTTGSTTFIIKEGAGQSGVSGHTFKILTASGGNRLSLDAVGGNLQIGASGAGGVTVGADVGNASASALLPTGLDFNSASVICWRPSAYAAVDTCIRRSGAGEVEINNGTSGQYRDLKSRNLTLSGTVNGVKTYRALLSQSGTDAPVATVLENSLGGTPVLARTGAGTYTATLTGAWTSNKTFITMGTTFANAASMVFFETAKTSANVITLTTRLFDHTGPSVLAEDGLLSSTEIQILVYP